MGSQQTIAGLGHSNTAKRFKIILSTKDDTPLELTHIPDGWRESEITFTRDPKYKGVIESVSTQELTFLKEARDYIMNAYERGGVDYVINIVYTIQNISTFLYDPYYSGIIDLSTYKIDEIGVTCSVIASSFQSSILNAVDIPVDVLSEKMIGGSSSAVPQITGMPTTFTIPEYIATGVADWSATNIVGEAVDGSEYNHYVPMTINGTEFPSGAAQSQTIDGTTPFFTSSYDGTLSLSGTINISITLFPETDRTSLEVSINKNGVAVKTYTKPLNDETFDITIDEDVVVEISDVITLTAVGQGLKAGGGSSLTGFFIYYDNVSVILSQNLGETIPELEVYGYNVFEYTARIIQLITGNPDPLESPLLGRTDSLPTSYASDGDASLLMMTKGQFLRQFPITSGTSTLQTFNGKLNNVFDSLNAITNIGMGFEVRSGVNKVVIDKEAYFFGITDNPDYPATDSEPYLVDQIADLSSLINVNEITKEALPDWYANEIEVGYQNFETEYVYGLKEFNTSSIYALPIKSIKNKLALISSFRFDTQGTNKLREKDYDSFPTEDVSGDNDVFGFDCKRDSGFVVKTDEDFDSVVGGIEPDQCYNLNYTPRRNLERHGNRIRSMRFADGDEVQWMQSPKNTKLITQKTGETSTKAESGDITVQDLDDGYWLPEGYGISVPISQTILSAIKSNPYGVFKLAPNKYGWIIELQTNTEDKLGELLLLRLNLNNVKVVV